MQDIPFTQTGFERLKNEYDELIAARPEAVEHLKRARELGDLSENGYYKASRAKLSSIDNRLFHLKIILKNAKIIHSLQSQYIEIGSTVILSNGEKDRTYMIVGKFEANPAEGKISDQSLLGKELLGKKIGDSVVVQAPAKTSHYTILKIL